MTEKTDDFLAVRPLWSEKNITPARSDQLADQIMRKALARTNDAVQRGRFEITDLEAITAACLATAMQAGEKSRTRAKITIISNLIRSLTGIIKTRDEVEIQRQMAEKVTKIEEQIVKIKDAAKNK